MSDQEFDRYLALLTRLLRLSGRQRDEIRRELRAHLEEALDEYLAQGLAQHDAVLRALEDFGDAAELAARFRAIGRTRRWIMRGTATAAGIGIAAVTASFFMSSPATPVQAGFKPAAMMQSGGAGGTLNDAKRDVGAADASAATLAALRKPIPEFEFEEVPFSNVVDFVAEHTGVNVVVQWAALEEAGIGRDSSVRLRLKQVSTDRMLSIMLDEISHGTTSVSHQVKDGILFISTTESLKRDLVTRVYDVRDLLTAGLDWQKSKERLLGRQPAAAFMIPPAAEPADSTLRSTLQSMIHAGGVSPPPTASDKRDEPDNELNWPERALTTVITETVEPDSWNCSGGAGTAAIYNGILIVRQHDAAHEDVEKLLLMLRDAGARGAAGDGKTSQ